MTPPGMMLKHDLKRKERARILQAGAFQRKYRVHGVLESENKQVG